jgi:hypothetical protein
LGWGRIGHKGHSKGSRGDQNTSPTSPSRTPTPHTFMGWLGRWVWFLGWGCGIPEPLRDMCRGLPGHKSLRPKLYVEPPLGERRGLPGLLSPTGRGIPGPFHIEVYGAGPNRADARRSLKTTMHRLELAPPVWWLLGEAPGTGMSQKFSLFRWRSETVR